MTKRLKKIIADTVTRWHETLTTTAQPDVEAAKKILRASNKNATIFVADSPLQFYIGQAIIRGRISKRNAKECCVGLNIDSSFVDEFARCGGVEEVLASNHWQRLNTNNIVDNMLFEYIRSADKKPAETLRRGFSSPAKLTNEINIRLNNVLQLYPLCIQHGKHKVGAFGYDLDYALNFGLRASTRKTERSTISVMDAISNSPHDILNGEFEHRSHMYDAIHAEIICRALNCKSPAITATFEIFHATPTVMSFRNNGYLICGKKPEISLNAGGEMHNETGQAVKWVDGTGLWFFDGHMLQERGEQIVMAPETLSYADISALKNEEERRIAIDRYGWGKYIAEGGGKVLDYRENYVDNTVEVLIKPPKAAETWRSEPLRMVLACRSTGRRYFIAVPHTEEGNRWEASVDENDATRIKTCVNAQNWLANGAVTEYLPFAKHALNIVGAS